ncbi:MAG: ATP-binding protein, partial [Bryobacterales bacterium]|nr:ATP-binding protein [Bryobacterales bacterium]
IGVDDNGKPCGIQPDLELRRWNTERYVRHLTDRIGKEFGSAAATCTHISIDLFESLEVCVVEVDPSPDPVWLSKAGKASKGSALYVRVSNSTRELQGPDLVSYLRKRWD